MSVNVSVAPGAQSPAVNSVTVGGGGASTVVTNLSTTIGTAASSAAEPYGVAYLSAQATGENGLADDQVGEHPFAQTLTFSLNAIYDTRGLNGAGGSYEEPVHTKDIVVDLPPGFVGDPDVVEKCPQYDVEPEACPAASQIGTAQIVPTGLRGYGTYKVYNVLPDKGYVAEFVIDYGKLAVPLDVRVNPETNYGLQVITPDIPELGSPMYVSVTFFGTPSTNPSIFNELRSSPSAAPVAFLDNPTHVHHRTAAGQAQRRSMGKAAANGSRTAHLTSAAPTGPPPRPRCFRR